MNDALLRAFLDDIKAAPDDDVPRLILADWLEEHGDTDADRAHGTLMRLQVRQAALARGEPEFGRLAGEITALLGRYRPTWRRCLTAGRGASVAYRRGLVRVTADTLRLPRTSRRSDTSTRGWEWVETLDLGCSSSGHRTLWDEPALDEIVELRLPGFVQPPSQIDHLTESPRLRRLRSLFVQNADLGEGRARSFAEWPGLARLRELALPCSRFDAGGIAILLGSPHLQRLSRLDLRRVYLGASSLAALAGCEALAKVRYLDIDLDLHEAGETGLGPLPRASFLPSLRYLGLDSVLLTTRMGDDLATLPLSGLRELRLGVYPRGCPLQCLLEAGWFSGLERLFLQYSRMAPPGSGFDPMPVELAAVVSAPTLRGLRALALPICDFPAADLARVLAAWDLPEVRYLDLSVSPLGEAGTAVLATWPGLAQLRVLRLVSCDLTDDAVRRLLASPYMAPDIELILGGSDQLSPGLGDEIRATGRSCVL